MEYCCKLTTCKAFIGSWKVRALACLSKPLRQLSLWLKPNGYKNHSADIEMAATKEEDAALITFTTGSTGNPKAARRSHAFLNAQFNALIDKIQPKASDVAMPVLPIVLLCNLGVGATSIIASYPSRKPEKFKPALVMEQIKKYKVNRITSSPYFVKRLAAHCTNYKIQLNSLEQIFTGGAPVFADEAKEYVQAFPDCRIEIVYGSTEAEPISSVNAKQLIAAKNNTEGLLVGSIYKHTALKIIKVTKEALTFTKPSDLEKLVVSDGSIGEIIVAGDHVLKEYFHAPEAWNQNKIVSDETLWHRTGDSGYIDENGQLFLTGRCKQLIEKEEGGYYAPFLFEGLLKQFQEIGLGTLVSTSNGLVLFAETKAKHKIDKLRTKISALLPQEIQEIKFVDYIPRDPRHHSKIDYGKLRALYG